jgi:hypothetical protein
MIAAARPVQQRSAASAARSDRLRAAQKNARNRIRQSRDGTVSIPLILVHRGTPLRVLGGSRLRVSAMDSFTCQTFTASPAEPGDSLGSLDLPSPILATGE